LLAGPKPEYLMLMTFVGPVGISRETIWRRISW